MKKIYKEYYELKQQLADMEDELKEKKAELVDALENEPGRKKKTKFASFSVYSKDYYKYSPVVEKAEQGLREMKKKEEKEGIAEHVKTNEWPVMRTARKRKEKQEVVEKESRSLVD